MSIGCLITNPKNQAEKEFYRPFATENFFETYWLPICEAKNLNWIKCFQTGIDISKSDFVDVANQLRIAKESIPSNWETSVREQLILRADLLETSLETIFARENANVWIG